MKKLNIEELQLNDKKYKEIEDFIDLKQAAILLGKGYNNIYKYCKRHRIHCIERLLNNTKRIFVSLNSLKDHAQKASIELNYDDFLKLKKAEDQKVKEYLFYRDSPDYITPSKLALILATSSGYIRYVLRNKKKYMCTNSGRKMSLFYRISDMEDVFEKKGINIRKIIEEEKSSNITKSCVQESNQIQHLPKQKVMQCANSYYTTKQAAEILNISCSNLLGIIRSGAIKVNNPHALNAIEYQVIKDSVHKYRDFVENKDIIKVSDSGNESYKQLQDILDIKTLLLIMPECKTFIEQNKHQDLTELVISGLKELQKLIQQREVA